MWGSEERENSRKALLDKPYLYLEMGAKDSRPG
jgi:hypothetical protein